ncbi:hypothetical protein Sjap_011181 [Stephania japonica]|uniref:Uncharacterized protein n=1 Tax=Stephania japonica TaxID=461633 RepID=A0AAP0JAW9_9MAGN
MPKTLPNPKITPETMKIGFSHLQRPNLGSRLVIFVGNPFIPRMLVLTIRGMEIVTVLAMHRHNPTSICLVQVHGVLNKNGEPSKT